MSSLSKYTLWVKASPLHGPASSYYKFLAAVDRGQYSAAAWRLASSGNVDAYPVVAALYQLAYMAAAPSVVTRVDKAAVVALLGGSQVPRSARVDGVRGLARYAAVVAGEMVYGDA